MKNLKVKSILFSLLAMMAVAVFLTSCEQEEVIVEEQISETILQDRANPCLISTGNCRTDCHNCWRWLDGQDLIARDSQIQNCLRRGGNYQDCVDAAVAQYDQASDDNYDNFLECYYGCSYEVVDF